MEAGGEATESRIGIISSALAVTAHNVCINESDYPPPCAAEEVREDDINVNERKLWITEQLSSKQLLSC